MPIELSSVVIQDKNKLANEGQWLVCLMITIPNYPNDTIVRVVRNNEDIMWRGEIWQKFPFEVDEITDSATGEVTQVTVRVSNVSRAMEYYIEMYDVYTKTYGFRPVSAVIYLVNSLDLANNDPVREHPFELKSPTTDAKWATFVLGASNPANRRFPLHRVLKNHCRFRFRSIHCGYNGVASSCDKTLKTCRTLQNSTRFGGFPGVGSGGVRV
jgi:phage-related protein